MLQNTYAMIMAGGAGTRLWPLSRESRPKPLLPLVEKTRSMFQISVDRLAPLFTPERIIVVANRELCELLSEQTPGIPRENFIVEPTGRDTAPAVGLGAVHIRHKNPDAIMAVLTADHHISDEAKFRQVLDTAARIAMNNSIVTLGINPTFASAGFGYLERGALLDTVGGVNVYELVRFIEKPDETRARELVSDPRYSWNSGMFIWPVSRVLSEFREHASDIYNDLETIAEAIDTTRYNQVLDEVWANIRRISVDFALMEHIQQDISVIPTEIGWSDIGNFGTLYDILSIAGSVEDNVTSVPHEPVMIDSDHNLVFSSRMVATIGIQDLVIIDTDDVLLVCHRDRVQDVKKLVEQLKKGQRVEFL